MQRPVDMFDREWEWEQLTRFVTDEGAGATLGVVSGRRRQGKTFLLRSTVEASGGFYYEALEGQPAEQLRHFGARLGAYTGTPAPLAFTDWEGAIAALLDLGRSRPTPVVIDELGYLVTTNPSLPSVLQAAFNPRSSDRARSRTRLLLCGSALTIMGSLLSGNAPLRGRASLELVVRTFEPRLAADLWELAPDWALALKVHAVVGGTPAYRYEFVRGDRPTHADDFDEWVCRTVLDPAMPLFRESRYLLAEDPGLGEVRDRPLYHATLAAIAQGNTTRGGIANYLARPSTDIGHPLTVLADAGFIERREDPLRSGRPTFAIAEPVVRFYHAISRPRWGDLERPGSARRVWEASQPTFRAQVLGPAFEELCRHWTRWHSTHDTGEVGSSRVADPGRRMNHEIDVVAMSPGPQSGSVTLLGEAKLGEVMDVDHLKRLRRIRELVGARRDVSATVLACFSAGGFTADLRTQASAADDVRLVDLAALYTGG